MVAWMVPEYKKSNRETGRVIMCRDFKNARWISLSLYILLAVVLFVVCEYLFISDLDNAFDTSTGGGFIPYSFGVVYGHMIAVIVSIGFSVVIKLLLKEKIKFYLLLIIAITVPFLCYNTSLRFFDRKGALRHMVDEGGVFYPLRSNPRDYTTITVDMLTSPKEDKTIIIDKSLVDHNTLSYVNALIYGTDDLVLDGEFTITGSDVVFSYRGFGTVYWGKILFSFKDSEKARNARIYRQDGDKRIQLENVKKDNSISVMLDAQAFLENEGEIRFVFSDD